MDSKGRRTAHRANKSRKRKNSESFDDESAKRVNGGQLSEGTSSQHQPWDQLNGHTSTPAVPITRYRRVSPVTAPDFSFSPVGAHFRQVEPRRSSPAVTTPRTPRTPSIRNKVDVLRQHIERCQHYASELHPDSGTSDPSIQELQKKAIQSFGEEDGPLVLKFLHDEINKYLKLYENGLRVSYRKSVDNAYLRAADRLVDSAKPDFSERRRMSLEPDIHPMVQSNRAIKDDEILKPIGKTATGPLYIVINTQKNEVACWKVSGSDARSRLSLRNVVLNECQALSLLRHGNIVKYYNSWVESNRLFLSMEYCVGASLFHYLYPARCPLNLTETHDTGDCLEKPERCLKERGLVRLLQHMADALDYLHYVADISHNDLKPSNILITLSVPRLQSIEYTFPNLTSTRVQVNEELKADKVDDIIFKLGDFGMSTRVDEVDGDCDMGDGRYMPSLESFDTSSAFAQGVDIYSLGVTMYQAAGGTMEDKLLSSFRFEGMQEEATEVLPEKLRKIVEKMVHVKPEQRYRADQLKVIASEL